MVEVFAPKNGILESIDYSILTGRKDIFYFTENRKVGEMVGRATDGKNFVAKFLIQSKNQNTTEKIAIELLQKIRDSIIVK